MNQAELAALAASVLALLAPAAPFLRQMGEAVAPEMGKEAWAKAKELYGRLKGRFTQDANPDAAQTLDLYLNRPATFEGALSQLLLETMQQHPEWATEIRALLSDPATQEIIARSSIFTRVTQSLAGTGGVQRIESDNSRLTDVRQEQR